MTRFFRRLLPAALLALVAAGPARAVDPEVPPTNKDIADKLDRIQRDLNELKDLRRDVNDLSQRVTRIEQNLRGAPDPRGRISGYMPPAGDTPQGTLRLRNSSNVVATVTVNGRPFRLEPNERIAEPFPAGPFTYDVQVDGFGVIRPAVSRTLPANQTFQITITPPPPVSIELPGVPTVPAVIVAGR